MGEVMGSARLSAITVDTQTNKTAELCQLCPCPVAGALMPAREGSSAEQPGASSTYINPGS